MGGVAPCQFGPVGLVGIATPSEQRGSFLTVSSSVWYFGYGSNMDPRTFLGRRRMRPHETRIALLDAWELRFDLPVGRGERAVANVAPAPGREVWGVAYRIDRPEAMRLDRTEGVHVGAYLRQPVSLNLPGEEDPTEAFTYHSKRSVPGRKPSRRYMGLLLAGARHHGLPDAYVTYLRSFELAVDERSGQRELF